MRCRPAYLALLAVVFAYALGTTAFGDGFAKLQEVFPSYPEIEARASRIEVPADALATLPVEMRVQVTNAKGVATEIDRRVWRAPSDAPAPAPSPVNLPR